MKKRIISMILSIVMVIGMLPMTVLAADVVASGYCGGEGDGTNLTWSLDSAGVLTISGTGEMKDYRGSSGTEPSPWSNYSNSIIKVDINEGVTTIGEGAFIYHDNISEIVFPASLEEIGIYSLAYCGKISTINLPNGLKKIQQHAFDNCSNLQYVSIPKTVTSISSYVFEDCPKLTSAGPIGGGYNIEFDWDIKIPAYAFSGCSSLQYILIPSTIERIGIECFTDCTQLLTAGPIGGNYNIEFGWTSEIPDAAFLGCPKLLSIDIPEYVDNIGDRAFSECYSLIDINVDNNNGTYTSVDGVLFSKDMTELVQYPSGKNGAYEIPQGVTSINSFAFGCTTQSGECNKLTSITFPESITNVDHCAFQGCLSIEKIEIPANVTHISYMAFNNCNNLSSAYFYGDAPATFDMTIGGIFDDCSDDFTIFYIKGKSGWTDSEAYDAATGTWNGYKLAVWGDGSSDEEDNTTYTHFGQYNGSTQNYVTDPETGLNDYYLDTVTIDGNKYTVSDSFKLTPIILMPDNYLKDFYYVAYNLNENNEIISAKIIPGTICTLERYDAINKIVDTDHEYLTVGDNSWRTLPLGDYYVSDVTASSFPTDKIGGWVGDQVRIYCVGEQIFKIIHITEGEGEVTSYDKDTTPDFVIIDGVTYKVANDENLRSTIASPFDNNSEYIKDAEFTMYDGTIVELTYTNERLDPANFNEYIYRADLSLQTGDEGYNDAYELAQDRLHGDIGAGTATSIAVESCKDSHFSTLANAWTATTKLFDTLVEGPGGTMQYLTVTQQDMYTAILFDSLESSFKSNIYENVDSVSGDVVDFVDILFQELDILIDIEGKTKADTLELIRSLNSEQQEYVMETVRLKFNDKYGDLEQGQDFISLLNTTLDAVDCIETWIENAIGYYKVLNLSNEMKTVIMEMYYACPSSNPNLKAALMNCYTVINAGAIGFADSILTSAGVFVITHLTDILWEYSFEVLETAFPVVKTIVLIYQASKFLIDSLTNIEGTTEAYYKLLALLNYENLARTVMDDLADDFLANKNLSTALHYLESVKLNFEVLKVDGNFAKDFYRELDASPTNFISEFFAGQTVDDLIADIELYQNRVNTSKIRFNTFWVFALQDDYPELFPLYENRYIEDWKLLKQITIACPVNVHIYNKDNELVAYVKDGAPYANGNISVVVENDIKHIYFYDDAEYKVVCEGYDSGNMDVIHVQYDESGKLNRSVNYFDLPVSSTKAYNIVISSDDIIINDSDKVIEPIYDSSKKTTAYTITINNGFATTNDTYENIITAHEGEIIDITTYVPSNKTFLGWTSNNSDVVFDDPNDISTSFIMVNSDIIINALTTAQAPVVTLDANGGNTQHSKITVADNGVMLTLPVATRNGYTFDGWHTDPVNGTEITTSTVFTSDTTIYAHWMKEHQAHNNSDNVYIFDDMNHWKVCDDCGESYDVEAHDESDWIIDKNATVSSDGSRHKECTVCGYILEIEVIPALNDDSFDYDAWRWTMIQLYNQTYTITAEANEGGSITPAGNTAVKYNRNQTYTITPDEGYEIEAVLVNGKDVGAVSEYTFKGVKKDQTITAVFAEKAWENPYEDIAESDWFYEDVEYVTVNGLMNGVESNKFAPESALTRGMIVTVLWRLEGSPDADFDMQFDDVEADTWYTEAVRWAAANGIVNGYGDGKFGPENDVTREQAAAILQRYAVYKSWDDGITLPMIPQYTYSAWAENSIIWADMNGLLDDIGEDTSDMTVAANRAEIAAYLRRFCERFMAE